jgi:hypothetical protein
MVHKYGDISGEEVCTLYARHWGSPFDEYLCLVDNDLLICSDTLQEFLTISYDQEPCSSSSADTTAAFPRDLWKHSLNEDLLRRMLQILHGFEPTVKNRRSWIVVKSFSAIIDRVWSQRKAHIVSQWEGKVYLAHTYPSIAPSQENANTSMPKTGMQDGFH